MTTYTAMIIGFGIGVAFTSAVIFYGFHRDKKRVEAFEERFREIRRSSQ